jgi:hypothetical protein
MRGGRNQGKQLGFTLSEIHDILACRGGDSGKTKLEMGLLPGKSGSWCGRF